MSLDLGGPLVYLTQGPGVSRIDYGDVLLPVHVWKFPMFIYFLASQNHLN